MYVLMHAVIESLSLHSSVNFPSGHIFHDKNISVPFYIYTSKDDVNFEIFLRNCGRPLFAKGVEVMWLEKLKAHPWRTHDPESALIFVIPGLFSVSVASEIGSIEKACGKGLYLVFRY